MAVNFIFPKDNKDEGVMHSKSVHKEIKINDKAGKVIEKVLKTLLSRYQNNLETSKRGSGFIFDCIHLYLYKCHKINPNRGEPYVDCSN